MILKTAKRFSMTIIAEKLNRAEVKKDWDSDGAVGGNIPHYIVYAELSAFDGKFGFTKHQIGEIHKVSKCERWSDNGAKFEIITDDNGDIGVVAHQFKTMKECLNKFARLAPKIIEAENVVSLIGGP
jgi:hypothetical protein